MSIWTRNLLDFKVVRILVVVIIIIVGVAYFIDSNSVESKCRYKAENLGSLPTSNEAMKLDFDTVKRQLVEECVKTNGIK